MGIPEIFHSGAQSADGLTGRGGDGTLRNRIQTRVWHLCAYMCSTVRLTFDSSRALSWASTVPLRPPVAAATAAAETRSRLHYCPHVGGQGPEDGRLPYGLP